MSAWSRTVAPDLVLRQFEAYDAEPLFALVQRQRAYLRQWLPWVDFTETVDDVRRFIVRTRNQFDANQGPQCAVVLNGEIAGSLGCHPIDWSNKHCSIGYWVSADQQGRGLMTQCCVSMIDYLFEELDLHRVVIQCGTGNTKSCAIPQRLGFVREGVLREAEWVNDRWVDLVVWGMLRQEWRNARNRLA